MYLIYKINSKGLTENIDVSKLSKGVYFIKINNNTLKFIKN